MSSHLEIPLNGFIFVNTKWRRC